MIELLKDKLKVLVTKEEKYNMLREYLQLITLQIIDEKGYFKNLAFVGGTALRILFKLNRFSEDLDFCLVDNTNYLFSTMMLTLEKELNLRGLNVTIRYKDHKNVASAFIKFDDLLFQLGLSPHHDEKIMVKFEVDQNTPTGFATAFTLLTQDMMVGINHFDLPSLFAGKLHALLCRKYTKGRDYYDFIWYIGQKIQPNYSLLTNAILQTEHEILDLTPEKLVTLLKQRINATDFSTVVQDVSPFLIDQRELRFFNQETFLALSSNLV